MQNPEEPRPREVCARCRKPASLCLCAHIERVPNRTHVLVVQHRRERSHAVGTARIARLGLSHTRILSAGHRVERPTVRPGAALLYPGPESRDLKEIPASERPRELVVLDGTWNHARRLFLDNPWIRDLPRVRLAPDSPSRYRIRKQPAPHCVSTLESLVAALRILEPETPGLDGLLEAFDAMVDAQQAFMLGPGAVPRVRHRSPRPSRALPESLRDPSRRVLVVYGETARDDAQQSCGPRQLLRWSALAHGADAAHFDGLVRPRGGPLPAWHLEHLGLDRGTVEGAPELEHLRAAWRDFRRAGDLVLAWHPATVSLLEQVDAEPPEFHALRSLWANVSHERPGGLDTLVERLGLELEAPPIPGRAAARLAQAAAVLDHVLEVAPREVYR